MKNYFIEPEYIPEAVAEVNKLHEWANKAIPELLPIIANARLIAFDTELSAKDKKLVKPILESSPSRAYIHFSVKSIWLKADIHFPIKNLDGGGHVVQYFSVDAYLERDRNNQDFEPYPIYDTKDVIKTIGEYKKAENEANKAECKADNIRNEIRPFCKQ